MAWYDFPITQGHSSDDGIDIGTPSRTPLYNLYFGRVVNTGFSDAGGVVFVAPANRSYSYYFLHLNDIAVKPGDIVYPGQLLGHSGGDVGDNVLHDGKVQPALDISWFDGHSTGHHTELGFFQGTDIGALNKGWGNHARQLDPTPVYDWLRAHGGDYTNTPWPDGSSQDNGGNSLLNGLGGGLLGGVGDALNPANWIPAAFQGAYKALGFSDAKNALWRVSFGAGGVLLVLVGFGFIGADLVSNAADAAAKTPIVGDALKAAK